MENKKGKIRKEVKSSTKLFQRIHNDSSVQKRQKAHEVVATLQISITSTTVFVIGILYFVFSN